MSCKLKRDTEQEQLLQQLLAGHVAHHIVRGPHSAAERSRRIALPQFALLRSIVGSTGTSILSPRARHYLGIFLAADATMESGADEKLPDGKELVFLCMELPVSVY